MSADAPLCDCHALQHLRSANGRINNAGAPCHRQARSASLSSLLQAAHLTTVWQRSGLLDLHLACWSSFAVHGQSRQAFLHSISSVPRACRLQASKVSAGHMQLHAAPEPECSCTGVCR